MAIKQETKDKYEHELYKGKKALAQVVDLAQEQGKGDKLQELFAKVDRVIKELERPDVNTVDVSNSYNAVLRTVNRFCKQLRGETVEEEEETVEAILLALEEGNPLKAVILYLQAGSQSIMKGYNLALGTNPWADSIPVFQELKRMSMKINECIKDVSKLPPPRKGESNEAG